MKYLLDTDHISLLQRKSRSGSAQLEARIAKHSILDFAFSIISFHEQVLGAHTFIARAKTPKDTIRGYTLLLEIFQGFSAVPILPFDARAANIFTHLRSQGIRIATMDLRIASIARSRDLILLTRNQKDFGKVPDLAIEDWTI